MENQERLIEVGKHENYFETENRTISLVQRIMVALNTLIFLHECDEMGKEIDI